MKTIIIKATVPDGFKPEAVDGCYDIPNTCVQQEKRIYEEDIEMIDLPTDAEIEVAASICNYETIRFQRGAQWVINKLK